MRYLLLIVFLVAVQPCTAKYAQVLYVESMADSVRQQDGFYVFENDTCRIVYSFWSERGMMSFLFYNKTNRPIYIDWKSSAFIGNGKRDIYYQDKEERRYRKTSSAVGYGAINVFQNYLTKTTVGIGAMNGGETIVREERITFVPPRSYLVKTVAPLVARECYNLSSPKFPKTQVKGVDIFESYIKENNVVRNYISYSVSESMMNPQYVDNAFQFKKVLTMKQRDFSKKDLETYETYSPWYSPSRFYIQRITGEKLFVDPYGFDD